MHLQHSVYAERSIWKSHDRKTSVVQPRLKPRRHLSTERAQGQGAAVWGSAGGIHLGLQPRAHSGRHSASWEFRMMLSHSTARAAVSKGYDKQADLQHCSHCDRTALLWISISPVLRVNKQTNRRKWAKHPNKLLNNTCTLRDTECVQLSQEGQII